MAANKQRPINKKRTTPRSPRSNKGVLLLRVVECAVELLVYARAVQIVGGLWADRV